MSRFRVVNPINMKETELTANSPQEACEKLNWLREECLVLELDSD